MAGIPADEWECQKHLTAFNFVYEGESIAVITHRDADGLTVQEAERSGDSLLC